jgi:hypothetical protein
LTYERLGNEQGQKKAHLVMALIGANGRMDNDHISKKGMTIAINREQWGTKRMYKKDELGDK